MTPVEFMKRKNQLALDEFGVVLVPEDQIEDVFVNRLDMRDDIHACPYCLEYSVGQTTCSECPMYKAGNYCGDHSSTYNAITEIIVDEENVSTEEAALIYYLPGLKDLVDKYNKSNGFDA